MDLAINYWAVLVAAVASFVIGWLWYGPLFGKEWMRLRGKDPAAMANMQMPVKGMAGEFIAALVTAYVLARFVVLLGVIDWTGATHLAIWVWLGFCVAATVGAIFWENMSWKLYAINAGRWLVSLGVMAIILGMWR